MLKSQPVVSNLLATSQKEGEGLCATALREVNLLKALNHPNIMSLEAIHMLPAELSLCLAFPYAETGECRDAGASERKLQLGWAGRGQGWLRSACRRCAGGLARMANTFGNRSAPAPICVPQISMT